MRGVNNPDCVVGWDIGGAHLKAVALDAAHRLRACQVLACPLWQGMSHLERAFAAALAALPATPRAHALTMTGEGCDLFADRVDGVARILELAQRTLGSPLRVYADDAGLVARAAPARTPVMAIAQRVPYRGVWQGMAAEYFATTADVYRVLGELPADADLMPSADGRPKTVRDSAARLARMVGEDLDVAGESAVLELAAWLRSAQLARLRAAVLRVGADSPVPVIVGAGVGRFLVREVAAWLGHAYLDFATALGIADAEAANDSAPALALAWLGLAA